MSRAHCGTCGKGKISADDDCVWCFMDDMENPEMERHRWINDKNAKRTMCVLVAFFVYALVATLLGADNVEL